MTARRTGIVLTFAVGGLLTGGAVAGVSANEDRLSYGNTVRALVLAAVIAGLILVALSRDEWPDEWPDDFWAYMRRVMAWSFLLCVLPSVACVYATREPLYFVAGLAGTYIAGCAALAVQEIAALWRERGHDQPA